VSRAVRDEAQALGVRVFEATCPLVTKVHVEVAKMREEGREIIMIGHQGHPEVEGTMGQSDGGMYLVETVADVQTLQVKSSDRLAYVTQTTLSVDDTADIIAALKARFPGIAEPKKGDICYATTNRQEAVKQVAPLVDALIVVGSSNSSNSQRLREVAERVGCPITRLVLRAEEIDWPAFEGIRKLGLTAGASAPEVLVEEIIDAFAARYDVMVDTVSTVIEDMVFPLPRELRSEAAE